MKWKGFTPEEIVLLRNNPYTLKVTERTMLKKTVYRSPSFSKREITALQSSESITDDIPAEKGSHRAIG